MATAGAVSGGPRQVSLGNEVVEAIVLPDVGARIHRLRAFGTDLLRTPADPRVHAQDPFFWGAYVMAPWCNRVAAGPQRVGRRQLDLPADFPDGSAIHGQLVTRRWEQVGDGSFTVRGGGDAWPWPYTAGLRLSAEAASLAIGLTLTNDADEAMPAGVGLHPWFRRPVSVAIHADATFGPNGRTPAPPMPVSGELDRRALGPMPDGLDATWTDLADPPVELAWPGSGVRATMRVGSSPGICVVAASPADIDAVAVEPQTHAPDGLRRLRESQPGALTLLAPGETLTPAIDVAFERA